MYKLSIINDNSTIHYLNVTLFLIMGLLGKLYLALGCPPLEGVGDGGSLPWMLLLLLVEGSTSMGLGRLVAAAETTSGVE